MTDMTGDQMDDLLIDIGHAIGMALATYHAHAGGDNDRLSAIGDKLNLVADDDSASPFVNLVLIGASEALRRRLRG